MSEELGILIPGEAAEIEHRARSQGWSAEEEFKADPKNAGKKWRPADEFLERGELFDTIKSLKHELTGIKRDFQNLAVHHKEVAKTEYNRALATLKEQRSLAAEEGDTKAVVDISDKIEELKEDFKTQVAENRSSVNEPHPAFTPWLAENPWYAEDEEMRAIADVQANKFLKVNPNAAFEETLKHVSKYVKEKYLTPKRSGVAPVEGASNGGSAPKKGKLTVADLSDMEKDIMKTMVSKKVMTQQEYLDDLAFAKGL